MPVDYAAQGAGEALLDAVDGPNLALILEKRMHRSWHGGSCAYKLFHRGARTACPFDISADIATKISAK